MSFEQAPEGRVLTYNEVLRGLSERAREGNVPALLGLERALRRMHDDTDEVAAAIEKILAAPD